MTNTPLSTEARRFVRLARKAIDDSRLQATHVMEPGAPSIEAAWDAFYVRLRKLGPIKLKQELIRYAKALDGITCCQAMFTKNSSRNTRFVLLVPSMTGHPIASLNEPDTLTIDMLVIEGARKGIRMRLATIGSVSGHALGRFAERSNIEIDEAPKAIRAIGCASSFVFPVDDNNPTERAIALRIPGRNKYRDDDIFLVGQLRKDRGFFADWRTVLPRCWLTSDLKRYGDTLMGLCVGDDDAKKEDLPFIPPRQDYITRRNDAA